MTDRVGQQLGNYQLIRLLGEGGFAEVYLGEHIHLGTQAAIKVLHTQLTSNDIDKFRTEARTIARLIHPHIVRILEFGVEKKTPFLVMDYAPHGTLRQRHPKGLALSPDIIVNYVKQIAEALQHAHGKKLIHRDIKPENMLLGEHDQVLLSDFGIALAAQSTQYQITQEVIGTAAYMAPEQFQGKPRLVSDQYGLGIVVYEWICGDRPFQGTFAELYSQHLFIPPSPLRGRVPMLPPAVEQVVQTALAKEPQQRFASIQAFATALEQAYQPDLPTIIKPRPSVSVPSADQPRASTIEAILSGQFGRTILGSAVIKIGRVSENQLVIKDTRVSSFHAEVHSMAGRHYLIDLQSLHGTFVNEQRLIPQTPHLLNHGDIIHIGDTKLTYERSGAPQSRAFTLDGSILFAESVDSGALPQKGSLSPPVNARDGKGSQPAYIQPSFHPPAIQLPTYIPPNGTSAATSSKETPAQPYTMASQSGFPNSTPLPVQLQKKSRRGLWIALAIVALVLLVGAGVGTFVFVTHSITSTPEKIITSTPEKTMDTYCNALLGQDYLTAYNQLSTTLQRDETESGFAQMLEAQGKITSCSHGSARINGATAFVNLIFASSSGQNSNSPVTLVQQSGNTWRISVSFPPVITLTTYCHALKNKDYQTAYDQLSNSLKSQVSESAYETNESQGDKSVGGISNCTVSNVNESNSSATGTITFIAGNGQSGIDHYTLTNESGIWKISGVQ